jgi:hypothetical protein
MAGPWQESSSLLMCLLMAATSRCSRAVEASEAKRRWPYSPSSRTTLTAIASKKFRIATLLLC